MSKKLSPQKGTYEDYLAGNIAGKLFTFRSLRKNGNSTMLTSSGKPVEYVPLFKIEAYDTIIENGKQMVIRLSPGEDTIYKSQQTDDKDVPKKKYKFQFVRGKKVVSGDNDGLLPLQWLFKSNYNASNPERRTDIQPLFEFVDMQQIIKKSMEDDDYKYETMKFCREGEDEKIKLVAQVLGINMNQSSSEIRYDLRILAERMDREKPGSFMEIAKSTRTRTKYYVLKAIEEGILVTNDMTNSIAWTTSPYQPLDTAPLGKNIIDSFVNKLSTDDGQLVFETIVDMLTPTQKKSKMAVPSESEIESLKQKVNPVTPTLGELPTESDDEILAMISTGVEKGVITVKKPWFNFKGTQGHSAKGMLGKFKGDLKLFEDFKLELSVRK